MVWKMSENQPSDEMKVIRDHRRQWRDCLYVYPVISRRAMGLSIGVNLNPEKRCTFSCVYCQINRRIQRNLHHVDIEAVRRELAEAVQAVTSGDIWREDRFAATPEAFRRINDIALSGDGEPTCMTNFDQAVQAAADVRSQFGCEQLKIVVITNATQFGQPQFLRALPRLDENNGEIWAKLDAGTDEYFQKVNRPAPAITLDQIVAGIADVARGRPVVIQTLMLRLDGKLPTPEEIDAYCRRLRNIVDTGGRLKLIQLHTIARSPQEAFAATLSKDELNAIARVVRDALPDVAVNTYYGADVKPQS